MLARIFFLTCVADLPQNKTSQNAAAYFDDDLDLADFVILLVWVLAFLGKKTETQRLSTDVMITSSASDFPWQKPEKPDGVIGVP